MHDSGQILHQISMYQNILQISKALNMPGSYTGTNYLSFLGFCHPTFGGTLTNKIYRYVKYVFA